LPVGPADDPLLDTSVDIPTHVVHRTFVDETVILDLSLGKYYGLNRTAGEMLAALSDTETIGEAAKKVAAHYERPLAEIQADICQLCRDLDERGLIHLGTPDGG
jgi:hypothetical protein